VISAPVRSPRVSLVLVRGAGDAAYQHWRRAVHGVRLASSEPGIPDPPTDLSGTAIVWRLESPNRRLMAWSAQHFATIGRAHDDARRSIAAVDELRTELVSGDAGHGWRLLAGAEPIAVSGRWYANARDRDRAVRVVLAALRSGAEAILAPPPFDMATGRWTEGAGKRVWLEQVLQEVGSVPLADRD
jgi:hypothetical protein